jgi:hypothetical protein
VKEVFKQIHDFLDKYQKTILTLILLLGGVAQFLELFIINPSFVRFFSITQLLSDGIALVIGISFIIFFIYIGKVNFNLIQSKNKLSKQLDYLLIILISLILLSSLIKEKSFLSNFNPWQYNKYLKEKWTRIFTTTFFIYLLLSTAVPYLYHWYLELKKNNGDSSQKKINKLIEFFISFVALLLSVPLTIVLSTIFVIAMYPIAEIYSEFQKPTNVLNIKNLEKKLEISYRNKNVNLLYFNDKYVFVKIDSNVLVLTNETFINEDLKNK